MDSIEMLGSAGQLLTVEEPDRDGEMAFGIEGDENTLWAYLGEADRIKLAHFLLKYTAVPGVTLHGTA